MKERTRIFTGKAKAKNPKYLRLTKWFDYLPDRFVIWFANKFFFFYYPYLIIEADVTYTDWIESRPYGSTYGLEYCCDVENIDFHVSNEENYERQPFSMKMFVFIFGKTKALDLSNRVLDMAFHHRCA